MTAYMHVATDFKALHRVSLVLNASEVAAWFMAWMRAACRRMHHRSEPPCRPPPPSTNQTPAYLQTNPEIFSKLLGEELSSARSNSPHADRLPAAPGRQPSTQQSQYSTASATTTLPATASRRPTLGRAGLGVTKSGVFVGCRMCGACAWSAYTSTHLRGVVDHLACFPC